MCRLPRRIRIAFAQRSVFVRATARVRRRSVTVHSGARGDGALKPPSAIVILTALISTAFPERPRITECAPSRHCEGLGIGETPETQEVAQRGTEPDSLHHGQLLGIEKRVGEPTPVRWPESDRFRPCARTGSAMWSTPP
jgi:hypothetical protein